MNPRFAATVKPTAVLDRPQVEPVPRDERYATAEAAHVELRGSAEFAGFQGDRFPMPSTLVVIRKYSHQIPAELTQAELEVAGVTAHLEAGLKPGHETITVELSMRLQDVHRALELLGPDH